MAHGFGARCLHCGQPSLILNERLSEEQRKAKWETNKLREELTSAKEDLEWERSQRKRAEDDLNKAQSDSIRLEKELQQYKKEFQKFVTENKKERLKAEKETKNLEETVRSGPITREDVQCIMESYRALTEQNTALMEIMVAIKIEISSLRKEKAELEDTIMAHKFSICDLEQNCATLEKEKSDLLSQLSQYQQQCNDGRCQQLVVECERILKEHEHMHNVLTSAECRRQKCVQMAQRITDLQQQLTGQAEQFKLKATKKVEETVRSGPITREDVQCLMKSYREQNEAVIEIMATINSSLRNEKTELEDTIMAHKVFTLEKEKSDLLSQLSQYQQQCKCQQLAVECERILKEHEHMHNVLTSAECRRQKCVQMAQRITDLQQQLARQAEQFKKLSLNKHMGPQQDTAHDQLNMEYEELWTNPDTILEQLEDHFDDSFDAKCFLTDLFMDAYKKSKRNILRLLYHNMDELYKVQPESRRAELEGLSRAYGLLLHSSGAKTLVTQPEAVCQISEEVQNTLQQLPRFSKVRGTLPDLPLDRVVEVAWKFVTQACPIIVCQPKEFTEELHRTWFDHWDENHDDSKPLIYARPVVYRNYHCVVLNRALVGNM